MIIEPNFNQIIRLG